MKVGAKVDIFNYRMRERRAELGITLYSLWKLSGVSIIDIQNIEKLRDVRGGIREAEDKLHKVATALECDFIELFPQDYLDMLAEKKLPKRRLPFIWVREISLEQLGSVEPGLLLPSAEELVLDDPDKNGLKQQLVNVMKDLPEREARIIDMRFGLRNGQSYTLEETAKFFGIHRERVRQIEAQALSRLRNSKYRRKLRDYLRL